MNTASPSIAVVIPAYNEARTIYDIVERALRHNDWIIAVDDGSSDGTGAILAALNITLLRNEINQGKAASMAAGISHALKHDATAIITMDADGQHRPEDIPRLLAAARETPDCIIIGARLRHRDKVPPARRFAQSLANFCLSWAAGHHIQDSQSGFRLYPADLFAKISISRKRRHSFVFESELLIDAARAGIYTRAIAIDAIYPANARPSHFKPVSDTLQIILMIGGKLLARGLYPQGLLRALRKR